MEIFTVEKIALIVAVIIILIGLYGALSQKNILKIIISFSVLDTGINIFIVALGYIAGRTAPIIDGNAVTVNNIAEKVIDPVPQALVLTAIVIGFGITALLLVFTLYMHKHKKTLNINHYDELKW